MDIMQFVQTILIINEYCRQIIDQLISFLFHHKTTDVQDANNILKSTTAEMLQLYLNYMVLSRVTKGFKRKNTWYSSQVFPKYTGSIEKNNNSYISMEAPQLTKFYVNYRLPVTDTPLNINNMSLITPSSYC